MTGDRARAYARVTHTLRELGPAKLLPAERERIRHAVDTLIFATDLHGDPSALAACSDIHALRDHLVASGRWSAFRADELVDDVWSAGPLPATFLPRAA
jgi:hypothetical protein